MDRFDRNLHIEPGSIDTGYDSCAADHPHPTVYHDISLALQKGIWEPAISGFSFSEMGSIDERIGTG